MKNGAKALLDTLTNLGVDTCFSNPGTSEMHFVAALDDSTIRSVLVLFEGVATGAADGYARIANKPAATLLHLGCGLGNGMANLHNARKARVPIVNIVGDHAFSHKEFDAPLESDIITVAKNVSSWIRVSQTTDELAKDAAEAITVASSDPTQISTLILPADVSWGEGGKAIESLELKKSPTVSDEKINEIAEVLSKYGKDVAILLGKRTLLEDGVIAAGKIAEKTGAKLFAETFPARLTRGAGLPFVERLAYMPEMLEIQLRNFKHLVVIDSKSPVSFFAYPGKKGDLVPEGCQVHEFISPSENAMDSLNLLVKKLDAENIKPTLQEAKRPKLPSGKLTGEKVCQAIGALMPDDTIICDEGQTSGVKLPYFTQGSPKHDVLTLCGGSIGMGTPLSVGASIAGKNRPVISLVGDGSAMYTIQSLWTIARENLDVTTIIMNNKSYAILNIELQRVGVDKVGEVAKSQLDLSKPEINFVSLANGMGMEGEKVTTAEGFNDALKKALNKKGPYLIEAVIPNEYQGLKLMALPHLLGIMDKIPTPIAKMVKKKFSP